MPLVALVCVLFATPAIDWLPLPDDVGSLLAALLGAQAAIAALTLAVTLFVMQGVSARRDVDDRLYQEYVRRSRVKPIFWGSIVAVGVTGLALIVEELGTGAPLVGSEPGLRNLPIVAAAAFAINLALPLLLFERAIHLARPDRWRALRRELNERDVREAVQVFLRRYRRVTGAAGAGQASLGDILPDPGESSANEAIQALLDEARRAMDERRRADFTEALKSIEGLVAHAMDEIEREGIRWGHPGSQPQWPPLWELGSLLYSFREEVIGRGIRDYVRKLLGNDRRLLRMGVERRCGELFTVALGGYRRNYEIATRVGNPELRATLRDRTWLVADQTLFPMSPEEAFPYARQLVRHQEQLLSDAMHADRRGDYEALARGFDRFLEMTRLGWRADDWPRRESTKLYEQLEQHYRIALMGLGGRATVLAREGDIANAAPYLEVARDKLTRPQQLADDVSRALVDEEYQGFSLWLDWDAKSAGDFGRQSVDRYRYPLTYFSVRLLELATSQMPSLDLHGSSERVLNWFTANSGRLETHAQDDPDASTGDRRERAIGALRDAVRRDEAAEDEDIIERELSAERTAAFTADVYSATFAANAIERLFVRASAFLYLPSDANDGLSTLRTCRPIAKGVLTEKPEHASITYALLNHDAWGKDLAFDVFQQLSEALDDVPAIEAPLGSAQELLSVIDEALEDINPQADLIVLLAGDWRDVLAEVAKQTPDGYQPGWQVPEADRCGETGRYRGHAIVRGPRDGDRWMYIVEPGAWGCFMRAQVEGDQDLRVKVDPILSERAGELLREYPDRFSEEPDDASKLRKWQTYVEVDVAARTGFHVIHPSRARRIVHSQPAQGQGSEPAAAPP